MRTLTIHPANMDQEAAVRLFLEALHISYGVSGKGVDETEYLSASLAIKERLVKSASREKNVTDIKTPLDDIISFRSYIGSQKRAF